MFLRAESKLEAVTRISAISGGAPASLGPGSKERKALLVDASTAFDLEVDPTLDKPRLAEQICAALRVSWDDTCWSAGQTITLEGLNRVLHALALAELASRDRSSEPRAARSKLEAVTRISALTAGPPQILGPGSKERKSVLTNLVDSLALDVDSTLNKPDLAEAIVVALGGSWDATCWSAGHTITLEGLNRVLERATAELERRGARPTSSTFDSVQTESEALLAILRTAVPEHMDGRECVTEMLQAESTHWAQDEWRGWYFEFVGLPALINAFGGGPAAVANTTFDYSLNQIWDLKCHGDDSGNAILNSREAMDACLEHRGVGLLVLSGTTVVDDGDFRQWQRDLRIANGKIPKARTRPATSQRRSKRGFIPRRLDAFFIEDEDMLAALLSNKTMGIMRQGRQTDGTARREKYMLNVKKAVGGPAHLASLPLSSASTPS